MPDTEPDADWMCGRRAGLVVMQLIVAAREGDALLRSPCKPDDLHRFLGRRDCLRRAIARPAHPLDSIPEAARTEAKFDPPAAQSIQRSCRLGEHRRWTKRKVGDIGKEPDAPGASGEEGHERPRIEEARQIGVILNG